MTLAVETWPVMFLRQAALPLTLLALAGSASAQTLCIATLSINADDASGTTTGTTSASRANTANDSAATRSASVDVTMGVIKAYSDVEALHSNNSGGNFAFATGSWQDMVTIDAPGLAGQSGQVQIAFTVDGTVISHGFSGSLSSSSTATTMFFVNDNKLAEYSERHRASAGYASNVPGGYLGKEMTQTFGFIYGQPFKMKLQVQAASSEAHNQGDGPSGATTDLAHTALWGGFDSVKNASGVEVSNFSVSSGSGTNWAQPVPEPATIAALGLGGLALLRRRKDMRRFRTGG